MLSTLLQQVLAFAGELKRREVFKTAGLYAAGAFLLTEILLVFVDRAPWTESGKALVACVVVTLFVAGFPIAVWLAWLFDLTRHGVSKESSWTKGSNVTAAAALLSVVAATGIFLWVLNPCGLGRVLGVAVLPCNSRGPVEQAHTGEAISTELNYLLSHLEQLRVPAQSSVAHFHETSGNPNELATSLQVERLVECAARQSDEKLVVNLQLFVPGSADNLWTGEYVGQASDELMLVAAAFRDLAGVDALNVGALAAARIEQHGRPPTLSGEAWRLYKQARGAELAQDSETALLLYQKAGVVDPGFARAHASAARLLWYSSLSSGDDDARRSAVLDAARAHLDQAMLAEHADAEALAMRRILSTSAEDAESLHEDIVDIRPSYAEEYLWWSAWLSGRGDSKEAAAALAKARTLDPSGNVERRYSLLWTSAE